MEDGDSDTDKYPHRTGHNAGHNQLHGTWTFLLLTKRAGGKFPSALLVFIPRLLENLLGKHGEVELPLLFNIRCKGTVVFLAFAQTAVDEAHQHHLGFEADGFVGGAVDVVMEDILKTVFLQPHA